MTVPLRHFIIGLAFLVAGGVVAIASVVGVGPTFTDVASLHLLLVGWVCVTIMGAMTQFVPVWSGARLYSRRLAVVQLWLVALGVAGLATALLVDRLDLLPVVGVPLLAGFWTFAYNLARTLPLGDPDVTEIHFALALTFLVVATGIGYILAADLAAPLLAGLPITRPAVIGAHVTLAVFGVILTAVVGALYQLATMFTQTDVKGIGIDVRRIETIAYPLGVVVLAAGRLTTSETLAQGGGLLVSASLLGVAVVLARRLHDARVPRTPMLTRYGVVAAALAAWALLTLPTWLREPLAADVRLGAPGTVNLLVFGVVGAVVIGTLYHVVPFLIWVRRYSDRLGFEDVPMIDDLYDGRLAALDFVLYVGGTAFLVGTDLLMLPKSTTTAGTILVVGGALVFLANVLLVVREHGPHSLAGLLFGRASGESGSSTKGG